MLQGSRVQLVCWAKPTEERHRSVPTNSGFLLPVPPHALSHGTPPGLQLRAFPPLCDLQAKPAKVLVAFAMFGSPSHNRLSEKVLLPFSFGVTALPSSFSCHVMEWAALAPFPEPTQSPHVPLPATHMRSCLTNFPACPRNHNAFSHKQESSSPRASCSSLLLVHRPHGANTNPKTPAGDVQT